MKNKVSLGAAFKAKNILVVGDVMLDRYLYGRVDRISPEAPVPIVNIEKTENRLGGAANVALNIKALGANPILCSIVGEDDNGQVLKNILPNYHINNNGIHTSKSRQTTVKSRVLSNNQQLLRCDREDRHLLSQAEEDQIFQFIKKTIRARPIHALLFQDYNKGVLSPSLIDQILKTCLQEGIPTAVDPKFHHFFSYKGVTLFKPNLKEVNDILPFKVKAEKQDLDKASEYIRAKLKNRYTMITLSEKGIYLDDGEESFILPTYPRLISDVCGAGDSVISCATIGIAAQLSIKDITAIANLAGGQVCEKVGVVPVNLAQLEQEFNDL